MRNSKANQVNSCFHENKLKLFETWEGIREIINISKEEKNGCYIYPNSLLRWIQQTLHRKKIAKPKQNKTNI